VTRRVAITGASGQLGTELVRAFADAGEEILPLARPAFDITRDVDLRRLTDWRPDIVVNSAAWTDVDGCARDPKRAMSINGTAAGSVASAAARAGALIVQVSTNEVFDGALERAYTEDDEPNPINPYGAAKLAGERLVAAANAHHLIVRTAWLFGPGRSNFVTKILAAANRARASGQPLRVVEDEVGNPTPTPWLAAAIVDLSRREAASVHGVLHAAGSPVTSRLGWAHEILSGTNVEIVPIRLSDFPRASTVPPRAALSSRRLAELGIPAGDWRTASALIARQVHA